MILQQIWAKQADNILENSLKIYFFERAGVKRGQFHDLRRTAITNWFANGMSENDVMVLAGHANFATTHEFYLAVADDLVDRAREATSKTLSQSLARIWRAPFSP